MVCLTTFFVAVLNFNLRVRTSAISGSANSNRSAPTRFAPETTFLRRIGIDFLQLLVQVHRIVQHVDHYIYIKEPLLVLKQPSSFDFFFKIERWKFLCTSK